MHIRTAPRLLFVVNSSDFFLSHRLPLAEAARSAGYTVEVATPQSEASSRITELGFTYYPIPLSRSGRNPALELISLVSIYRLMLRVNPDIVHLVTIKPTLYGGLAARLAGIRAVVVAISGLGSMFVGGHTDRNLTRRLIEFLYRSALKHRNFRAIFQNPDDRNVLTKVGAVRDADTVLIRGSGVNLDQYAVLPEPFGPPVISYAARLLKEKGVLEFIEAAKIIRNRGYNARFLLIGEPDPGNPSSVTEDELRAWSSEGIVEILGFRRDIPKLFSQSNIVTLPSYYGEGLPKVLVEAAACGRPVVTTNHPGCRDAIKENVTGLLVPARDPIALAEALITLIENPDLRAKMGKAGRDLAEQDFDVLKIVSAHMQVYQSLLNT